ncbi:hypothetical protein SAMN05216600_10319 [Pseudomonas cuatrocienegasensis]|uniref:ABC transporter permease n=1 Tax=Pseudomonas cuatrocienegasensis TaxID=543360 RepID=A0ABY1B5W8_9PSED|nr:MULTISPECIES: hypothetical protein [Pseudomonas]OEC36662.1 hypothetical protein A7D25_02005 [Pseudomonas sp. 21C1]SEQ02523.1 hypothetical protein SAMN05216600_10319 [Pseudomonas cuatrocienegasensis]
MIAMHWRSLWPESQRLLFALAICSTLTILSVYFGPKVRGNSMQNVQTLAWLLAGLQWGLLVSARPFQLAWHMLGLRMPGAIRVVSLGVVANLGLCLLAISSLAALSEYANVSRLGAGLLLGWSLALLILVLPAHHITAAIVPVLLLAGTYWQAWWPQTTAEYGVPALVILTLAAALWFYVCKRRWPILALAVEMPLRLTVQDEDVALFRKANAPDLSAGLSPVQRLREVLAPELKGIIQEASWPNRLLGALFVCSGIGFLLWLEPNRGTRFVIAYGIVAACLMLVSQPARYLLAERNRTSQSLVAELCLLPGLPSDRRWLLGLCLQILRGMSERLVFLGLFISLIGWNYGFPTAWLQWVWLYLLVILSLGLAQALQIGLLGYTLGRWRLFEFVMMIVAIASSAWLLSKDESTSLLLWSWLVLLALSLAFCVRLFQGLQRRGAPYFS